MKTLSLEKSDFKKKDGNYWSDYIGKEIEVGADVSIEIDASLGWVRFDRLNVKGYILAKAGTGIKAGEGIICKLSLKFAYRLFAGTATWRDMENESKDIVCGKLEGGTVCYGTVKELGLPNKKNETSLKGKKVSVEIDGTKYSATLD